MAIPSWSMWVQGGYCHFCRMWLGSCFNKVNFLLHNIDYGWKICNLNAFKGVFEPHLWLCCALLQLKVDGCKYVDRSQWDYFTKGPWVLFNKFSLFHMKEFLHEISCNLLLKIYIVAPIDHTFFVNHCWINMNLSKCVKFVKFYILNWKFIIILNHTKIY
jgi:hypothetical protein